MKKIKRSEIIAFAVVLIMFLIGIFVYPYMPAEMASHWNAKGETDGVSGKFLGIFLMPIITLVLFVMFLIIPRVDPKKNNIEKARPNFDGIMCIVLAYMMYLYALILAWNFGIQFNFNRLFSPAMGILFIAMGIFVKDMKPNWTVGIRTPWTLSDEFVWKKTHKVGGKLFMVAGVMAMFGAIFTD
jgi:uncharacterized membrane protein